MVFFVLTRFVLVKYSRGFVERPLQGTSSLASRLTTVSLDATYKHVYLLNVVELITCIVGLLSPKSWRNNARGA